MQANGSDSTVDAPIDLESLHLRERLHTLGTNLWWSWDHRLDAVLRRIDADLWDRVRHNPTAFVRDVPAQRLEDAAPSVIPDVIAIEDSLATYVADTRTWAGSYCHGVVEQAAVAYFSPEFCIHESLPIYSGGLGVLAGDHLKSCSDLGVGAVGVSLLYRHGYFHQQVGADGWQSESYDEIDPVRLPITRVLAADGSALVIEIPLGDAVLHADLWRVDVGRCPLFLLDPRDWPQAVLPGAHRLYGGNRDTRLAQEVVLGVGGYRALCAMGMKPKTLHMNEGHSAFAAFEAIASRIEDSGLSFDEAAVDVASSVVFTTHTPVEAGHDRFEPEALLAALAPLRARLGISDERLLSFGRVHPEDASEPFCMTVSAIKLARHTNAVSSLHGHVSRRMWRAMWPARRELDVPIGHVTNGVHRPTWLAPEFGAIYGASLARDGSNPIERALAERELLELDDERLWSIKRQMKRRLLEFVRARALARNARTGSADAAPALDPDALTIGLARRFALYKRALLPFRDLERVRRLLLCEQRPVQFLIAGKAHPADEPAKNVIRSVLALARDNGLASRVVFVEGYGQRISGLMLAGCDLWLNVPRRPLEACGTSGMKAVLNSTLNCSTLDGWWDEAWDPEVGFAVGDGRVHVDASVQDDRDAEAVLDVLEHEVIPLFYDRDARGIPRGWLSRVRTALARLGYRYNSDRMVADYARLLYEPAAGTVSAEIRR
ncbi:MAG TPA: alpha-glucan family phosphorylase [Candidatus Binatia bacterium]|jgi:starch phosphorylase